METVSTDELQILREKSRTFCGTFKIPLSKLEPEDIPVNPRQPDQRNVANLVERFGLEDCKQLKRDHYVPALISSADLPPGGQHSLFEEPQFFDPPRPLICLDGTHRLEAAGQFLAGDDRWWVADLYSDGMRWASTLILPTFANGSDINDQAKNSLREQDSGSAKYFDGDIYRHIRIAALDKGTESDAQKSKWLARLSPGKRYSVSRMESSSVMRGVQDGLDALIPLTGLWPPLELGQFPRLLQIHCPEVLAPLSQCLPLIF